MSQKGAYSYEYMDSWRRFNDSSLPDKKKFWQLSRNLTMEDITDADNKHTKRVRKDAENKIWMIITIFTFKVIKYCRRCFWKLPQQVRWNIWAWSNILFGSTRIRVASMSDENRSLIGIIYRRWHATKDREVFRGGMCQAINW